ncbi:MAG: hypothetical protein IKQ46_04430 [Bacteroidales bacterium]|nr:hypothetical protein [Bacteroidales bacterium]
MAFGLSFQDYGNFQGIKKSADLTLSTLQGPENCPYQSISQRPRKGVDIRRLIHD